MSAGEKDFLPRRAFSLIELLLVLGIILVLSGLLYSSNSRSYQTRQTAACQKNLQTIALALEVYAGDSHGAFPVVKTAATSEEPLSLLVPKYTAATGPFLCPGAKESPLPEAESFAARRISYAYYMGWRSTNAGTALVTDRQVNTQPKTRGQPLFSADGKGPGSNHGKFGGNILFIDGHAEAAAAAAPFNLTPPPEISLLNPRPR